MAKKVIERIFKVINLLINIVIGIIAAACACAYGTSAYMYSDTILRIPWIIGMAFTVNLVDYWIRKMIREF